MIFNNIYFNEGLNFIGHILISIILCYILIPKAQLIILIFVSLGFGALREYIQKKNGHLQYKWMLYTDILSWGIGGVIYYYIRGPLKLSKINQGY